jgi:hypothetical protein
MILRVNNFSEQLQGGYSGCSDNTSLNEIRGLRTMPSTLAATGLLHFRNGDYVSCLL